MIRDELDDGRWRRLLDEVAVGVEGESARDLWDEVAERTRFERGQVLLVDRLRAAAGSTLRFHMSDGTVRDATPGDDRAGDGWVLVAHPDGSAGIVVLDHVEAVAGLRSGTAPAEDSATRRRGVRDVMKVLARDRTPAQFHLLGGHRIAGCIAWVGKDHIAVVDGLPSGARPAAGRGTAVSLRHICWVAVAPGRELHQD